MATRTVTGKIYDSDGVSPLRRLDLHFHYLDDDPDDGMFFKFDAMSLLPEPSVSTFTDDNGDFSAAIEVGKRTAFTCSPVWDAIHPNAGVDQNLFEGAWTPRTLITVPPGTGSISIRECPSANMPTPPPSAKLVALGGCYPPGMDHYPPPPSRSTHFFYPFDTWRYPRTFVWRS